MAMNDDLQIKYHVETEESQKVSRDVPVRFEIDHFDFEDRFDMEFDAGF